MAKKHGHEAKHAHCEHCLHACDHCEVAYCCDCNKEWGTCRLSHGYNWPWYVTSTPTISPSPVTVGDLWTTSYGDGTNTDITITTSDVSDCIHAHTN